MLLDIFAIVSIVVGGICTIIFVIIGVLSFFCAPLMIKKRKESGFKLIYTVAFTVGTALIFFFIAALFALLMGWGLHHFGLMLNYFNSPFLWISN